jgi:Tol biopolymer transport system component
LRYQSASDLRADLKRLKRDSSSGKSAAVPAASSSGLSETVTVTPETSAVTVTSKIAQPFWLKLSIAFLLLILAAGFLVYRYLQPKARALPTKLVQISHWNKPMVSAALSQDGNTLAFSSVSEGILQVFVMLTSGGEPLQLTKDEGDKFVNGFSTDGTEIYYVRGFGRDEVWSLPALGGVPRRIVSGYYMVSSRDGKSYFYFKDSERGIFRTSAPEFEEQKVYPGKPTLRPLWLLPYDDGTHMLLIAGENPYSELHFIKVDLVSSNGEDLGKVPPAGSYPNAQWWERGKSVLLARDVNGITNLWMYDLEKHSYTQVTSGPGYDTSPMRDPQGKGIYFVNGKGTGALIVYDVKTGRTNEIVTEDASQPTISPDKSKVMYVKFRQRNLRELWISDLDGQNKIKLASGGRLSTADWFPDSSRISFINYDNDRLYSIGADGQGLRSIDWRGKELDWMIWSADGKAMYISSDIGGKRNIWKADANGSNFQKFTDQGFSASDSTSDGKYLVGMISYGPDTGVYQISVDQKKRIPVSQGTATYFVHVSKDGKSILYPVAGRGEILIYRQKWNNGQLIGKPEIAVKVPFAFPLEYFGNAFDFSRDLSTIVYARPGGQDDLYLLKYE